MDVRAHHDEDTGTNTITPVLRMEVDRQQAQKILGPEFDRAAFSSMTEAEGNPTFGYRRMVPNLACEKHHVKLLGHGPFASIPILAKIEPVSGKPAVLLTLQLPLEYQSNEFGGALLANLGQVIDVHMQASQMELPLAVQGGHAVANNHAGPFGKGKPVLVQ